MAKCILSKKSLRLNLTQQQICIFREIIDLGNQMANLLSGMPPKQITNTDFKMAMKLVGEWGTFKNIFIGKIISLLECMGSLEKACEEYSKLVSDVDNLNNAKVIMASMLDRIRQNVNLLKNSLI